jgi:hypothetical protein
MLNFGCNDSGCYIFNACDSDNPSRIIHLAFALKSYAIDKTDASTFLESLYAGELTGEVKMIRNITGEKPRPETTELAGFGLNSIKVGSSNHTINFMDQHVVENLDFYNKFRFASSQYDLYYFTDGLLWDASGNRVSFYGDPVFTNGPTDLIMGEATIKWTAKGSPAPFNEAFDTDSLENGLYYIPTIAGNPDGQISMVEDESITRTVTASLSEYVTNSCDLIFSFQNPIVSDLVTISINETTGVISFTGTLNGGGVVEFTVVVENNCGGCVKGTFDIVLTISST